MASLAFTSFMIHPLPFPPLNTKTKTNNSCFCFPVCRFVSSSEKFNFFSLSPLPKPTHATASSSDQHSQQHEEEEDNDNNDENFEVLTAIRSKFNDIVIVDTSTSRMLLLDHTSSPFILSFVEIFTHLIYKIESLLILQIMFIAFSTRVFRNGLIVTGYAVSSGQSCTCILSLLCFENMYVYLFV